MTLRERLNLKEGDVIIAKCYLGDTYEFKVMDFSSIPILSYLGIYDEEIYVYGQLLNNGRYDGLPLDHKNWTFVKKINKVMDVIEVKGSSVCPLCGSVGDDLLFAFYCSNEGCQNYRK